MVCYVISLRFKLMPNFMCYVITCIGKSFV